MNDIIAMVALSQVPQIGPRRGIELVQYFGSPSNVWLATQNDIIQSGILPATFASALNNSSYLEKANDLIEVNSSQGIDTIHYFDSHYPGRLKHIPDPPLILHAQGISGILNHPRSIAIVGTRMPSAYGVDRVKELIADLTVFEPHIISGFAYGIDITAHQEALRVNLPTSAILANGLDKIYPSLHQKYIPKICEKGAMVTEFPLGVKAEREFFPMRNRIVAGLCDLTIVVESKRKGGSMITAWMANEYQREVATFPGSIQSALSQGPHQLIKRNQAHLIESAADVVELMRWTEQPSAAEQMELFEKLNSDESRIIDLLRKEGKVHLDELSFQTQMKSGELAMHLLQLEMKGLIVALPGNRLSLP